MRTALSTGQPTVARPRLFCGDLVLERDGEWVFERLLDPLTDAYLGDHLVNGRPTVPGTVVLQIAADAAGQLVPARVPVAFESVRLRRFLRLPRAGSAATLRVTASLRPSADDLSVVHIPDALSDLRAPNGMSLRRDQLHFELDVILADTRPPAPIWDPGLTFPGRPVADPYVLDNPAVRLRGAFDTLRDGAATGQGATAQLVLPPAAYQQPFDRFSDSGTDPGRPRAHLGAGAGYGGVRATAGPVVHRPGGPVRRRQRRRVGERVRADPPGVPTGSCGRQQRRIPVRGAVPGWAAAAPASLTVRRGDRVVASGDRTVPGRSRAGSRGGGLTAAPHGGGEPADGPAREVSTTVVPVPPRDDARTPPGTARQRLLDTAEQLFYAEGIRAVSVDRLIGVARVTRATFYHHFSSKEDLVREYLTQRDHRIRARLASIAPGLPDAHAVADVLAAAIIDEICQAGFRGCAFINAAAEYSTADNFVTQAVTHIAPGSTRRSQTCSPPSARGDPSTVADAVLMLRDGAMTAGYLNDPDAVRATFAKALHRIVDD